MKRISMIITSAPTLDLAAYAQRARLMGLVTLALAILVSGSFAPAARLQAQTKPDGNQQKQQAQVVEQQPTPEQVRAHFQQRMGERLKSRDGKLKNGWQSVYVTPRGTHYYAFVRGGRVVDSAFGSPKLGEILRARLPNGIHAAPRPGQVLAQDTGDNPTQEECWRRAILCVISDDVGFWEALKEARHLLTLDLDGIDSDADAAKARMDKCMGNCKLGID